MGLLDRRLGRRRFLGEAAAISAALGALQAGFPLARAERLGEPVSDLVAPETPELFSGWDFPSAARQVSATSDELVRRYGAPKGYRGMAWAIDANGRYAIRRIAPTPEGLAALQARDELPVQGIAWDHRRLGTQGADPASSGVIIDPYAAVAASPIYRTELELRRSRHKLRLHEMAAGRRPPAGWIKG